MDLQALANVIMDSITNSKSNYVFMGDVSLVRAALSIEKIRKRIFFHLMTFSNDLLQCRLVCRQWRQDITKEFVFQQKYNTIVIGKPKGSSNFQAIRPSYSDKKPTLKEPLSALLELMDSTSTNPFPCANFKIIVDNLKESETEIYAFLKSQGARIQNLKLVIQCSQSCSTQDYIHLKKYSSLCPHSVNWLKTFIAKLLVEFAPNLVNLSVRLESPVSDPRQKVCDFDGDDHVMNPVRSEAIFKKQLNLLHIDFKSQIPKELWDVICSNSSNLESIKSLFNVENYLKPKNRLRLLKKFVFFSNHLDDYSLSRPAIYELANMEGELHIQTFNIFVTFDQNCVKKMLEAAQICYKLISKSCQSLIEFDWVPMEYLPGLKLPKLPNVKYINFTSTFGNESPTLKYFPLEGIMLWSETFPKLRRIRIESSIFKCSHTENDGFLGLKADVEVIYTGLDPADLDNCELMSVW